MKKGWIIWGTVLGFAAAILVSIAPALRHVRQMEEERAYLKRLKSQMESVDPALAGKHLSLAKWYNWNLRSENPDPDYGHAYGELLGFADGVMGILILPEGEFPVYHQGDAGEIPGAEHQADSALPVGGRGNHCVLQLPPGVPPEQLAQSGAAISCLGRTIFYRPAEQSQLQDNCDLLTLVSADGGEAILLQRSGVISIPEGKQTDSLEFLCRAAGGAVFAGILPVCLGLGLDRLTGRHRKSGNHRKNR